MELKIAHISDIHLGSKFLFLGEKANEHRERIWQTLKKSLADAVARNCKLVVITGDIFDYPNPGAKDKERLEGLFSEVVDKGIRVVILPGNHDLLGDGSVWGNWKQSGVHVCGQKNGVKGEANVDGGTNRNAASASVFDFVEYEDLGVQIWASAVTAKKSSLPDLEALAREIKQHKSAHEGKQDLARIVLLHSPLDININSGKGQVNITKDSLAKLEADYIALGDWHSTMDVGGEQFTAWYAGSPEILSLSEKDSGNYLIINLISESDKFKARVEKVRISELQLHRKQADLSLIKLTELTRELESLRSPNNIVNLVLRGEIEPGNTLDTDEIESRFSAEFYYLRVRDMTKIEAGLSDTENLPKGSIQSEFVRLIKKRQDSGEITEEVAGMALKIGLSMFNK